jgi:hypothetical protein
MNKEANMKSVTFYLLMVMGSAQISECIARAQVVESRTTSSSVSASNSDVFKKERVAKRKLPDVDLHAHMYHMQVVTRCLVGAGLVALIGIVVYACVAKK